MGLLNEAAPRLGDGSGVSEVSHVINQEAEIVVASLVSIAIKKLGGVLATEKQVYNLKDP